MAGAVTTAEARFRTAINAGFDAFVIVRASRDAAGAVSDFIIVDANDRAAALVDRTVSDIVGGSLLDVFIYSRATQLWEQCCAVVDHGEPLEITQFAPLPGKPGRWVQRQLLPLDDGVAISSRDVTTQYLERVALENSEARHRRLFEGSGAVQLLVDAARGQIVDANPAAEQFYGWPRAAMQSMLITDLDSRTLDAWRADTDRLAVGAGMHARAEHRVAHGDARQVELFSGSLEVEGRRLVHLIVQDVSDRVRAESGLRESEALFRAVINGMREGVILYEANGTVQVHNPSAERVLGLTGGQLRGTEPMASDWETVHEDGSPWPFVSHPSREALRTGESQPVALMGIRHPGGEFTWARVSADPLTRDGESQPYASVTLLADVTEVRGAEERLRQAQKLEAVGQLAGGIAHDFNNALTVIRGATGFLRDAVPANSHAAEDIAAIDRATDRAEGLTRQLLAFGRRQPLRAEPTMLNTLVREYAVTLRESLPMSAPGSVRVELELTDDRTPVKVDRRRVLDALRILVDNARNAMPDGGTLVFGTRTLSRALPLRDGRPGPERQWVELMVRDTGSGMSDDVQARLFEPFFSTQPFGTSKGMGLPSVHGMMAQSGGAIECESAAGAGTTFRLLFPFAEAGAPATAVPAPATVPSRAGSVAPAPRAKPAPTRQALLVDDDPMMRELCRRMLEALSFGVTIAESGEQALTLLASLQPLPPLMVIDLTMPGMSGIELIAAAAERYPSLSFVAISGFAVHPDMRTALGARGVPMVSKPFTRNSLADAIARAGVA